MHDTHVCVFVVGSGRRKQVDRPTTRSHQRQTWEDLASLSHSGEDVGRSVLKLPEVESVIPDCCCWIQYSLFNCGGDRHPPCHGGHYGVWSVRPAEIRDSY